MYKSLGHNSFSEKTHESSKIVVFTNEFLQDLVFVFFKNKRNRVGLKNKGLFLLFVFIYEYTTSTGFFPPFSCVFRILIGDSFVYLFTARRIRKIKDSFSPLFSVYLYTNIKLLFL